MVKVKKDVGRKGRVVSRTIRAFTIQPVAGWLILEGIKDVENRWIAPVDKTGMMAVTFSKIYSRKQYKSDMRWVRRFAGKDVAARVPSYEAMGEFRGKCVGVVDYEIRESSSSKWWEVHKWKPWCLSNPRWLSAPFAVSGQIGCWHMTPEVTQKVMSQLRGRPAAKVRKTVVKAKLVELKRAFTVHPGWAWAICAGVKKQEWRTFLPNPRKGTCAVHVSKSYGRSQWRREDESVFEWWGVHLPPYEDLVENWCGKMVAVCDYEASEDDWDGDAYGWRLSRVRLLKRRIACQGALKLWTLDPALAQRILKEV